ncbi:hypothetical protein CC1G_13970 [Coprinopsis cinerea okayama7|uniref:Uncharacterized protein n=1 Tax=Coprinopsis cinerea (strain Okayama-7 / 130 / ATCC MYA-4618 / FGSC 9003) TaxID=240176 RepID=D6RKI6_COPC7|nr:hypothetical protein CC1G_13970 [Coprinopsis cinerea okayama7\|eukprot:XP_002911931.1 hypothetical protein CC1G_13970 [Coprinopsis cinerea okayama7\
MIQDENLKRAALEQNVDSVTKMLRCGPEGEVDADLSKEQTGLGEPGCSYRRALALP